MKTYPLLDFGLGETAKLLRESVQDFVSQEIAPLAAEIDRNDHFPPELWQKMGALGLLGVTVPEQYGGAAMGYLEHVIAMEEISRGSASVGLAYGAHSNLCVNQIKLNGTEEQKQRYLPDLVSGRHIGALAMSEAGSGSDVVSMRLAAVESGRRLYPERHQDVDHQRPQRRCPGGLRQDLAGEEAARHHRLSGREDLCRFFHQPQARQARHARFAHLRAGLSGLPGAEGQYPRASSTEASRS